MFLCKCMYIMCVCMYGWMDEWMDRWMDVRMYAWMHACMPCKSNSTCEIRVTLHGISSGWWFQPLWTILVSCDDYFQYLEKKHVPNHQPVMDFHGFSMIFPIKKPPAAQDLRPPGAAFGSRGRRSARAAWRRRAARNRRRKRRRNRRRRWPGVWFRSKRHSLFNIIYIIYIIYNFHHLLSWNQYNYITNNYLSIYLSVYLSIYLYDKL